ncbi:DUF1508 domain-containing protein [Pinibacter soli]|uniref:DUF1508 domain-containing protein n=1 Tax=Pinibacter soli TaxID=3044211 RepID=A0ABT6RC29_9BACT|nr:DUF1508 domain-containing protein [Pinibacter soli]MDI3320133.1 DUF1508 domain-containing protein [Pinibacter soli]
MVRFIISRTRHKKFYFTVESQELTTLLTSEFYTSKTACKKGIVALKNAVQGIGRYQWVEEKDNTVYFIIKSINGQRLASSERYNSLPQSNDVLSMLKTEVPQAVVVDQTGNLRSHKTTAISFEVAERTI